jgi:hypothetical protein
LGRVLCVSALTLESGSAFGQTPPAASFPEDDTAPSAAPEPGPVPTSDAAPAAAPAPAPEESAPTPPPAPPVPPTTTAPTYEPPAPEEPEERAAPSGPHVSLTFSPVHLLIGPIFEMQVEAQVAPHFGVSLIGGIGTIKAESSTAGTVKFSAYELGGQLVGYPLADFKSLQLGAELLWVKVSTEEVNGERLSADAGGFAVGPFIGYKLITKIGFTFFAQGGFQYLTARADATDDDGTSASAEDSTFVPLLNLNVGWSF